MSQRNKRHKQGNNRMMMSLSLVFVLVLIAAAIAGSSIWMQTQGGSSSVNGAVKPTAIKLIAPKAYQAEFVSPARPHLLVDVRTPQEFAGGHIEGAVNIPLQSLEQRMGEIPQDEPVVIYCRSGNRSNTAARILAQAGYTDIYDLGGVIAWQSQGLALKTAR